MPTISEKWFSNKPRSRGAKRIEIEKISIGGSRPAALDPAGDVSMMFHRYDAEGYLLSIWVSMTPAEARDLGRRLLALHEWAVIEPAWNEALAEEKRRLEEFFVLAAWDEALRENATMPRGTLACGGDTQCARCRGTGAVGGVKCEICNGLGHGPSRSWAPEVIADSSGQWCGNGLRFATKEEAEANVWNLSMRWMLVRETRVVESVDPVNYQWSVETGLVRCRKDAP